MKRGWIGSDFPGLRPARGTYDFYEEVPPLGVSFDGSLSWLPPLAPNVKTEMARYTDAKQRAQLLETAKTILATPNLPPAFVALFGNPERLDDFYSSTACFFTLSGPFAALGGRRLIRFLNDQQGTVVWYLDLAGPVLGTNRNLESDPRPFEHNVFLVADSFEEFLYRYWLENLLWRRLSHNVPLTHAQSAYAKFYGYDGPV